MRYEENAGILRFAQNDNSEFYTVIVKILGDTVQLSG